MSDPLPPRRLFKKEKTPEPMDRLFLAAQIRIQELEDLVDIQVETIKNQARAIDHWRARARAVGSDNSEREPRSVLHPTNPLLDGWE